MPFLSDALLLGLIWPGVWTALLAAAVFGMLARWALLRAFHGINGDMIGAMIEGGELWLLLCLWSWWQFATG